MVLRNSCNIAIINIYQRTCSQRCVIYHTTKAHHSSLLWVERKHHVQMQDLWPTCSCLKMNLKNGPKGLTVVYEMQRYLSQKFELRILIKIQLMNCSANTVKFYQCAFKNFFVFFHRNNNSQQHNCLKFSFYYSAHNVYWEYVRFGKMSVFEIMIHLYICEFRKSE